MANHCAEKINPSGTPRSASAEESHQVSFLPVGEFSDLAGPEEVLAVGSVDLYTGNDDVLARLWVDGSSSCVPRRLLDDVIRGVGQLDQVRNLAVRQVSQELLHAQRQTIARLVKR
jgi:hypothetical protein